jgi:hypothetical protein
VVVEQVRTSAAAEMEALVMTLAELGVNKVGALVTVSPKDSLPSQYMEQFMYFADLAGIQMMSVSTLNINSWLTDFSLNGACVPCLVPLHIRLAMPPTPPLLPLLRVPTSSLPALHLHSTLKTLVVVEQVGCRTVSRLRRPTHCEAWTMPGATRS